MTFAARTTTTLVAVLAVMAVAAMPAFSSPMSVIRDCSEDGVLNGKYSQSELDGALEQLPSDLDEYTDCRSVIRRAQLGSAGDKRRARRPASAADRVDAATPPSGEEQQEIARAAGSDDPVRIGKVGVRPGGSGEPFDSTAFGTDLPPLVLVALLGLVGALISGLALAVRRRLGAAAGGGRLSRLGEGVRRGVSRFRR